MDELLIQYQPIAPATWAYVSSLLTIGLFFKFNRIWSVRNLDLFAIILLAPGILMVHAGQTSKSADEFAVAAGPEAAADIESEADEPPSESGGDAARPAEVAADDDGPTVADGGAAPTTSRADVLKRTGYSLLFAACGLLLARLLIDPAMIRRPLLEPNLLPGGMAFIGCSLFVFLTANVATGPPNASALAGAVAAERLAAGEARPDDLAPAAEPTPEAAADGLAQYGPGYPLLFVLPNISTSRVMASPVDDEALRPGRVRVATARVMAVLSQLAIVAGMIVIAYIHFDNVRTGVAAATLYLLLPYTAIMTGRVDHCLPAALLVWTVAAYRRPLLAGVLLGLCSGVIYYTFWLLPLWISFYWQRGAKRFLQGFGLSVLVLVVVLALSSSGIGQFFSHVGQMIGFRWPLEVDADGFWNVHHPYYRAPVLAAFVVLSLSMALWPAQKNLGTLLSCSASVMLAAQFWHAHGGGTFMAWFLPLTLMAIFRPNLEDRVALAVLGDAWFERTHSPVAGGVVAASRARASGSAGVAWTEDGVVTRS